MIAWVAVAVGAAAQAVTGIGFALVCAPFLVSLDGRDGVRTVILLSAALNLVMMVRERRDVFVLCEPDVVGVLVLRPADGDALMVENVAVDPDSQGNGFGPALLEFADRQARERGVQELRLYTHELMTSNIELYRRLGWTEYDRVPSNGFARVFMRKRVTTLPAAD